MFDRKAYRKLYHQIHKEQENRKNKEYQLAHKEERKIYMREYRKKLSLEQKEKIRNKGRKRDRIHYWGNRELKMEAMKLYQQSPRGRQAIHRRRAIRKQFGFIPLNESFEGAHAHHIDKEKVIYIPEELHKSIWHSVTKNINMEAINNVAFGYCH